MNLWLTDQVNQFTQHWPINASHPSLQAMTYPYTENADKEWHWVNNLTWKYQPVAILTQLAEKRSSVTRVLILAKWNIVRLLSITIPRIKKVHWTLCTWIPFVSGNPPRVDWVHRQRRCADCSRCTSRCSCTGLSALRLLHLGFTQHCSVDESYVTQGAWQYGWVSFLSLLIFPLYWAHKIDSVKALPLQWHIWCNSWYAPSSGNIAPTEYTFIV